MTSTDWSLTRALAAFVAVLRQRGVTVSPAESVDVLAALEHIPIQRQSVFASTLRSCLAKTPIERARFDAVFEVFWYAQDLEHVQPLDTASRDSAYDELRQIVHFGEGSAQTDSMDVSDDQDSAPGWGGDAQRRCMYTDFARSSGDESEAMHDLIRTIGRRLALRAGRRWRSRARGTLDMRATLRRAIPKGGELFELRKRYRSRERPRLVVLTDVSHSMDAYSLFFLRFVYAFAQAFRSVESFVFSTRLSRVTTALSRSRFEAALAGLPRHVTDWGGGTRIAGSLETYLERYADTQLDRSTVVMILSDGWDTNEPEQLEAVLKQLRSLCRVLIWLDPMLEHPRYFASARGVQHESLAIDICAPAHNIDALACLADRLSREKWV